MRSACGTSATDEEKNDITYEDLKR